jgi:hypothetical protein
MTLHLNKRKIESTCIMISFLLLIVLTVTIILAIADGLFHWDLLPDKIENIAFLIMWASGIVLIAAFIISLMINLSLISSGIKEISEKISSHDK